VIGGCAFTTKDLAKTLRFADMRQLDTKDISSGGSIYGVDESSESGVTREDKSGKASNDFF